MLMKRLIYESRTGRQGEYLGEGLGVGIWGLYMWSVGGGNLMKVRDDDIWV